MQVRTHIGKRSVKKRLRSGEVKEYPRYVLTYNDPITAKRVERFFKTKKEAEAEQNSLIISVSDGSHSPTRKIPTIAEAVKHYMSHREGNIRKSTYVGYQLLADYIVGPVLNGTPTERGNYRIHGTIAEGCELVPMLGPIKVNELTTARIRQWEQELGDLTSKGMAGRCRQLLKLCLNMAEEDFGIRTPKLPQNMTRGTKRVKKQILTIEQLRYLVEEMKKDKEWGIYVAWPFLTGTRIGEQLGLLWKDIDFSNNQIFICRTQMFGTGELSEMTKTDAGHRIIPMNDELRQMLLEWRVRCPRKDGELHRVFPGQGYIVTRPVWERKNAGGPLLHANFRNRVWRPALKRLGLPLITPHAARHMVISMLQAEGIEVGLVSKIVGHANPSITIRHYTHPVRAAGDAMERLSKAYKGATD